VQEQDVQGSIRTLTVASKKEMSMIGYIYFYIVDQN